MVSLLFPCFLSDLGLRASAYLSYSGRRPWFHKFRAGLAVTTTIQEMETFLRIKVERWRGKPPRFRDGEPDEEINPDDGKEESA